ncbi:hypothetical protein DI383_09570 [Flavobacteriaceae bacterium LYZ1037]|jgi:transposase-like protein|nr:hypothetical protein DI383_09570 [Flavobacteriaceae bacterium LYZ1037]
MKESKTLLEIGIYLNKRVKELAFDDFFHFFMDCLSNGARLANDKEVSEILYDAIDYGNFYVPTDINTAKFTIHSLLIIADYNIKPMYSKEKLAREIGVHEQTLNEWLRVFDETLYLKVFDERKLTFENLYLIMVSLGFTESKKILKRSELAKKCKLKSSELKKNLPEHIRFPFEKFMKYPPIFSNQVLEQLDVELLD